MQSMPYINLLILYRMNSERRITAKAANANANAKHRINTETQKRILKEQTNFLKTLRNERVSRARATANATQRNPKRTGVVTFNNLAKRKGSYPVQISFPLKEESKSYKKNTNATVSSSSDNAEVSVVFQEVIRDENPLPRLRAEFYKISGLKNNIYEIPLPNPGNKPPEAYEKVEGKDSQKTTRITHEFSSRGTPLFSVTYSADIYIDLTDWANPRPFVWYLNIKDHTGTFNGVKYAKTNRNEKGITKVKSREERVFKGIPIYILDKNPGEPLADLLWK
jgi:hypothetical protein